MSQYVNQSEATRSLAAEQTHNDLHPGHAIATVPSHEEIAKKAYAIYVNSGQQAGHCERNWLAAESSLHHTDKSTRRATREVQKRKSAASALQTAAGR